MKRFDKYKLDKCKNWNDSMEFFKSLDKRDLIEFINALEDAQRFIDLTMRDESLLATAKSELQYRK